MNTDNSKFKIRTSTLKRMLKKVAIGEPPLDPPQYSEPQGRAFLENIVIESDDDIWDQIPEPIYQNFATSFNIGEEDSRDIKFNIDYDLEDGGKGQLVSVYTEAGEIPVLKMTEQQKTVTNAVIENYLMRDDVHNQLTEQVVEVLQGEQEAAEESAAEAKYERMQEDRYGDPRF